MEPSFWTPERGTFDIAHLYVREKVEEQSLETKYVSNNYNLADLLTKALPHDVHNRLSRFILVDPEADSGRQRPFPLEFHLQEQERASDDQECTLLVEECRSKWTIVHM